MKKNDETGANSKEKNPAWWRNDARMRLLAALPSFQKRVDNIRKQFGIPPKKADVPDFYIHVANLAKEYNLPPQLYYDPKRDAWMRADEFPVGVLARYICSNTINVPQENFFMEIEFDKDNPTSIQIENRPPINPSRWISVKIFAPLRGTEFTKAIKGLKLLQKRFLAWENTPPRTRERFNRDLEIFRELSFRENPHPKRKKVYAGGSYIDRLAKSKQTSSKEMGRQERLHSSDIKISYNDKIAQQVAERFGISKDAVRKAKERIEKSATEWFGPDWRDGRQV